MKKLKLVFEVIGIFATVIGGVLAIIQIYEYVAGQPNKKNVEVDARGHGSLRGWKDTNIDLSLRYEYTVEAEGKISIDRDPNSNFKSSEPDGNPNSYCLSFKCGTLVGRIGATGKTFLIGTKKEIEDEEGRLYMSIWDNIASDNEGFYKVTITKK